MVHNSEYFKKRYQLFIRLLKENNLYGEFRKIKENWDIFHNTMLEKRILTKGQASHILMVAIGVKNIYRDFEVFFQYSKEDVLIKIEKLKPKWKKIVKKLENE